ncbi:hypothetical protein DS079_06815 [Brachybacterium paraconglomeratum]|uniref:Uncharacterized protein n=1 Tax=Brachybacterium paraconglomeratum TaxID=173362 RepID=A0A3R8QP67_9MICO|nr:hypothetical protein DS079_06815 [Brachybacterium paraconglomeratum]
MELHRCHSFTVVESLIVIERWTAYRFSEPSDDTPPQILDFRPCSSVLLGRCCRPPALHIHDEQEPTDLIITAVDLVDNRHLSRS